MLIGFITIFSDMAAHQVFMKSILEENFKVSVDDGNAHAYAAEHRFESGALILCSSERCSQGLLGLLPFSRCRFAPGEIPPQRLTLGNELLSTFCPIVHMHVTLQVI
jgi:hypothetical protein